MPSFRWRGWWIPVLADGDDDHFPLLDDLASALGTDAIDLVDLSSASAFLRYRAARDGIPVFERTPGTFVDFAVAASLFWCDIETVVRRAHEDLLAELACRSGWIRPCWPSGRLPSTATSAAWTTSFPAPLTICGRPRRPPMG